MCFQMPNSGSAYYPYVITYRGTNSQGNHYDNRIQPCGRGYHYSNTDGSYYYANGNGSTYHNDGRGHSTYINAQGRVTEKFVYYKGA